MKATPKQRACLQNRTVRFVIDDKHNELLKRIIDMELPPSVISDLVGLSFNVKAEYGSGESLPADRKRAKMDFTAMLDSILK